jgi:hypothetical protein
VRPHLQNNHSKMDWRCGWSSRAPASKHEALSSSNPSPIKKKKEVTSNLIACCYGANVSSQTIYWTLTTSVIVWRGEPLEEIRSWGRAEPSWMVLQPMKEVKKDHLGPSVFSHAEIQHSFLSEEAETGPPSLDTKPASFLIFDIQRPEWWEINFFFWQINQSRVFCYRSTDIIQNLGKWGLGPLKQRAKNWTYVASRC